MARADVVVVGGGLLGLATAHALHGRRDVVVLERDTIGHARGGSHGRSRVFRLGYADPLYIHMAQQALELWRVLEREAGVELLSVTGQLSFGAGARDVLHALTAAGAPASELSEGDVAARFPMFAGHGPAVFEPASGVIAADATLRALRAAAACEVRERTHVRRIDDRDHGVRVETDAGPVDANVAVVCAGPWTRQLIDAGDTFTTLEHVAYVRPQTDRSMPVFIAHTEPAVYGLPTPGSPLYKIALHHAGVMVDPDAEFCPEPTAVRALEDATRAWLPDFDPVAAEIDVCPYDNTPDEDFVLERSGNVVVGAGTSGHGFKFGPLLGELLASLVVGTPPRGPLDRFSRSSRGRAR